MRKQVIGPKEAAAQITSGSTVVFDGFVMAVHADEICAAIEQRFLETGEPRDLKIISVTSVGDGKDKGLNRLAHEGLVASLTAGHWNLMPKMQKLAVENKIFAYNLPQGVIAQLYREVASGRPGLFTKIGLGTFVDPRQMGGKINEKTRKEGADVVELFDIHGETYLHYFPFSMDFVCLRGTSADEKGNISMEKEALFGMSFAAAQAGKNCGAKVFVEVERVIKDGFLNPQLVKIPGIYIDAIVQSESKEMHMQTAKQEFCPYYSGQERRPVTLDLMPMSAKKIIARRGMKEVRKGEIINLGIGLPEDVARVAYEQGCFEELDLTVEAGTIGGLPMGGTEFGVAINPDMILSHGEQFDFYHGGGLDSAFLGFAQCDPKGNINVSKFGPRIAGCGGFIGITQTAKNLYFMGTFTAKGLEVEIKDGKLAILQEGSIKKFNCEIEQITFAAESQAGRRIKLFTERAVFGYTPEGLVLEEIAPGIDLEKDILSQMEFRPQVAENLKIMDADIFE